MLHENQDAQSSDLHAENQVKKIMLEVDYDATFFDGEEELPAEVESQWLDYIRNFEENHKNAKQVTVAELAGNPELRKADEIPDEEIKAAYESLIQLLESKGISFCALAEYPESDRLFYKFITEVLFKEETDDYIMPGGFRCYTYEEFVPNHDYDIRQRTNELISYLFDDMRTKKERFDEYFFDVNDFIEIDEPDKTYPKKISPSLTAFLDAYPVRKLENSEIKHLEFAISEQEENDVQGEATVNLLIHYSAIAESGEPRHFTGTGNLKLQLQWSWWRIVKIELPGLILGN